jgi:hypothetical protein
MDKMPVIAEADLLPAALDAVRGLGLDAATEPAPLERGGLVADAIVRLGLADAGQRYVVAVKRQLRPANLGAALHQLDRQAELYGLPGLLVADHITPDMAETLRQQGRAFLDLAGNAHIRQAAALVWVTGRKPVAKTMAPAVGRAFQPTGLQVLFALLCHPEWVNLPYRELATRAGVAHGTVGWVMPDLQQQGFVTELKGKRGTRRLYETERLLALWVDPYARQLRPRTLLGRYYVATLDGWQDWPLAAHEAQWGGEPAAALLTQYLQPGELTLYADKLPGLLAGKYRFMKEPDVGHQAVVEVRRRFWRFPQADGDGDGDACVPPVLVYADLLATGDARCIETAKRLYETHVVRLVRQA